jgi:hypothetical protein
MALRSRLLALLASLLIVPGAAQAAVNLGNFGVQDPRLDTGGFDVGPVIEDPVPPGGGGGGPSYTLSDLEEQGYICRAIAGSETVCTGCSFVDANETQVCTVHVCLSSSNCNMRRTRWDVPRDVEPADFSLWAREFAFGASPYWVGDLDGDGRRDLAGQVGPAVHAALSTGSYFQNVGPWSGPAPVESAGPSLMADVNGDGIADVLSVSAAGHLVAGISTGSAIAASVELTNTWCEGLGDCLIGDVNGDGMPDLVEVMRGAIESHRTGDVWVSLATDVPGFPSVPSAPVPPDGDGDGVRDNQDNCLDVPNASQLDADGDEIGNACDADLNGDGIVNEADANLFATCFFAVVSARPECAASDLDGDGTVGFADAPIMQGAMGQPPGPAAAYQPPRIELFTPEDGAILPVGASKAWVAGWVPNLPAGGVQVRVGGQSVAVSGPSNYFAAFVDLPATDASGAPKVFHGVLVEATRGTQRSALRRAVIVGEHTAPSRRSHSALGARLTAAGLERIEEFAREELVPGIVSGVPAAINGYSSDLDCVEEFGVIWPVCTTGHTISNAQIAIPDVAVELQPNGVAVFASIPSLDLDLTVHGTGPTPASWSCGGHVSVTNIEASLLYGFTVGNGGHLEVVELQEPVVSANVSYSACGEDDVKAKVREMLVSFLNDADDVNGLTHGIYQKSPIGAGVEEIFASLDLSGTYTEEVEDPVLTQAFFADSRLADTVFGADPLSLTYDARFELVTQDAAGLSLWLGASIEPAEPIASLGGPQGAYQIPGFAPPALPNTLVSGSAFDIAAAVTPNGLNELLDALTRAGELSSLGEVRREVDINGVEVPLTAGMLAGAITAFAAYPALEAITVELAPPTFAPVVTGRRGPRNEAIDLHLPQFGITFRDESGDVALALRADLRVGVELGFGGSGSGELSATARSLEVLAFAITDNPIGADAAEVALRVLCHPVIPEDIFGCALEDERTNGLDLELESIELPSLADSDAGFRLDGLCLQRLADGTFVAQFDLLLPGETTPASSGLPVFDSRCMAPLTTTDVDTGGGTSGPRGGLIGTLGLTTTLEATATTTPTATGTLGATALGTSTLSTRR